jgi:prevent-host-death family protein
MQTRSISVTEAARNFSDCVNRARYQGVTFILHRNGVPVARIVPEAAKRQNVAPKEALADSDATPEIETLTSEQSRSLW